MCKPPVSGGTDAERTLVSGVVCAVGATNLQVKIGPAPRGLPKGGIGLVIDARVPTQPSSASSPTAALSAYANEEASWHAAIIAGAVRDESERQHLPHVVYYELRFVARGGTPQRQSQGRIALPGWGDPEGQGSTPPSTLGHGTASFDQMQLKLERIAARTNASVRLGWAQPLGAAPAVIITAKNPRQLLAGAIKQYLAVAQFSEARYDGVLIVVYDTKGRPVWLATTAARVGDTGCAVLSAEAGKSHGSFPSFNSAGDRACADAGVGFS